MKKIYKSILALSITLSGLNVQAQTLLSESFTGTVFPPSGWLSVQTAGTGTSLWDRQTTGSDPTCSPYSAPGMAWFNSYSFAADEAAILVTPAISFTMTGPKEVSFFMYRDSGYSSDADSVSVYVNTTNSITSTAANLGIINRNSSLTPTVAADGWYQYSFTVPASFNTATNYIIFQGYSQYGNNMFIDNIVVSNLVPADVGVSSLIAPLLNNCFSSTEAAKVEIKNYGTASSSNFPVKVIMSGAASATLTGTYTGVLAPGTSTVYTLPGTFNMNAVGTYSFMSYTSLTGDGNTSNDTISESRTSAISVPVGGTTTASSTLACLGQTINLNLNGSTPGINGLTYQWESSSNGTTWTSIPSSTNNTASDTFTAPTYYQAILSCAGNTATSAPILIGLTGPLVYAPVPFLENFDSTWQNRCDIRNVPTFASWSSNPTTGNNSWRRQDDGSSASWSGPSSGTVSPLAGPGCADFHTYYAPDGSTGDLNVSLNLNGPSYALSFYYNNASGDDSLEVFLSTDGGSTFAKQAGYTTNSNWTKEFINLTGVNSSSCVIRFTATSDYGADDIAMDSLQVYAFCITPTVTVASSATTICNGSSVTYSASGVATYSWSTGAVTSSISVTPTVNTTYSVTGTNTLGCSATEIISVTVNPTPTVTATTNTNVICMGQTATLQASGATSYTWSNGATGNTTTVSPIANISYIVVGSTSLGCSGMQSISFSVNPTPVLSMGSSTNAVCAGNTVTLTISGATSYTWSTGANTGTITDAPSASTIYSVTGANSLGCSITQGLFITVNPNPTITVVSSPSIVCVGSTASLTGSGATGYVWSTGDVLPVIVVSPTTSNTLTYTLTGTSTLGCSETVTVSEAVSLCTGIANHSVNSNLGATVFPNPGTGEFTVELNNGYSKTIEVTDFTGRIVLTDSTLKDKMNIDISTLSNGVYFVKIQSNNAVEVIKVVKQ